MRNSMTHWETIFNEHEQLLINKGFDDKSLNSPFRKGILFEELKRNIGMVTSSQYENDATIGFTLKTVGAFNEAEDMVQYHLHYKFDPVKDLLELYQLDVKWGQHQGRYNLNTSYDLPSANDALDRLKREAGLQKSLGKTIKINYPKKIKPRLGRHF